ncbi:MAG: hypothetical protein MUC57_15750 [Desulfobacterales bacterium]|jgi:hypothetical protein|nr:hypothetical protein [Desulfobacterales bacterium]
MSNRKTYLKIFVFLWGGVFLLVSPVIADTVDQGLAQLSAAVKDHAREMIQKGMAGEDAVQFIQALNANRFQEDQILKAQAIVLEAQGRGLPAKPIINKAFEGMAKQVPPERTLQAMGAVSSRYAFAFEQARAITQNAEPIGRLGNMLAESLAAGLTEQDASRIINQLQAQSPKLNQSQLDELAAACLAMARDMSRLGVASALSSQVISNALANGLSVASIAGMHQSVLAQSQTHSAQSVAQGMAHGMQQGQPTPGLGGMTGGQAGQSGQGGSGGSGGGAGGGGAGGGSGGGGAGGGGGGAGGPGGGGAGGGGNR